MAQQGSNNQCVDHCHDTGLVRDVLCRNCNGIEAKINRLLHRGKRNLSVELYFAYIVEYKDYWEHQHKVWPEQYHVHPTHKTPEQKKELAKKRRKRKASK